jgi:hypothetical protein
VFLRFGVDREVRIAIGLVLVDQIGDPMKLGVAIGMLAARQVFAYLPPSYPRVVKPAFNRVPSHRSAHLCQLLG